MISDIEGLLELVEEVRGKDLRKLGGDELSDYAFRLATMQVYLGELVMGAWEIAENDQEEYEERKNEDYLTAIKDMPATQAKPYSENLNKNFKRKAMDSKVKSRRLEKLAENTKTLITTLQSRLKQLGVENKL